MDLSLPWTLIVGSRSHRAPSHPHRAPSRHCLDSVKSWHLRTCHGAVVGRNGGGGRGVREGGNENGWMREEGRSEEAPKHARPFFFLIQAHSSADEQRRDSDGARVIGCRGPWTLGWDWGDFRKLTLIRRSGLTSALLPDTHDTITGTYMTGGQPGAGGREGSRVCGPGMCQAWGTGEGRESGRLPCPMPWGPPAAASPCKPAAALPGPARYIYLLPWPRFLPSRSPFS
ncbi:hypothetical protein GGR56DRAFT_365147 [Xylariaceae sp. FL0804]|nr:hypothetical protein GGR56DRAFT_365147 [Xylariaceae sp. FL0804]